MSIEVSDRVDVSPGKIQRIVELGRWMHAAHGGMAARTAGKNAALAKDRHFMQFMEKFVTALDRLCEAEQGDTRRTSTAAFRPEPMVQQVYRKAFEAAQDGHPHLINNFECQLGAMAVAAHITPRPYEAPSW